MRFRLTNPTSVNAITIFPLLFIERVSILKSGNILGYDINGEDILFHNYKKAMDKKNMGNLSFGMFGMNLTLSGILASGTIYPNGSLYTLFELPLSLNNSNICSSMIKNDLTIRIHFKGNVVIDAIQNSELKFSDAQLVLRMKELDSQNKIILHKRPKINHMFQKKILYKYNIPALVNGQQYKVNLA